MKINKLFVIGFIVGGLLFSGSIYAASRINANEIEYTTSKNSEIETVEDAALFLYDRSKNGISDLRNIKNRTNALPNGFHGASLTLEKGYYLCNFVMETAYGYKTASVNSVNNDSWNETFGCTTYNMLYNNGASVSAPNLLRSTWYNMLY